MKAITYARYGPPEVLSLADVSAPVPKDDEVLIRVRAAEATKSDCEMRSFRFSVRWFWLPLRLALGVRRPRRRILGAYFAGEIARVGRDPALSEKMNIDKVQLLQKMREWYNGYRFHKLDQSVYNPFSLLNFVQNKDFDNYWHLSGMPKMMRKYFRPGELRDFEATEMNGEGLQTFDIEELDIVSLMFQTGYLTITGHDPEHDYYTLAFPNQEVRKRAGR